MAQILDSLSKGCFLVPPSKSADTSIRDSKLISGFQKLNGGQEHPSLVLQRLDRYTSKWDEIRAEAESLIVKVNDQTFQDLDEFISKSNTDVGDSNSIRLPVRELPTALVFAGTNISDHTPVFKQIASQTLESGRCDRVAMLYSKDCPNLKSILSNMIEQIIGRQKALETETVAADDEDDDITDLFASKRGICSVATDDIQLLLGWHAEWTAGKSRDGKLVLIVPDFEGFDTVVLHDFIRILSSYQHTLPFVLILGIATSMSAIHQAFPRSVLSLLRTQTFTIEQSTTYINKIVEHIFIRRHRGMKLSFSSFHNMLDDFNLCSRSAKSFMNSLQYSLMDHYYSNPLSILTDVDPEDDQELEKVLNLMNEECIVMIRMLGSFKRHIEGLCENGELTEARNLLEDDEYLLQAVSGYLSELEAYHQRFDAAFRLLLRIQDSAPPTFRRPIRTLYSKSLEPPGLGQSAHIRELMLVMRKIKSAELRECLSDCIHILGDFRDIDSLLPNFRTKLIDLLADYDRIRQQEREDAEDDDDDGDEDESSDEEDGNFLKLGTLKRLAEETSKLKSRRTTVVSKRLKPLIDLEEIDKDSIEYVSKRAAAEFQDLFSQTLKPPSSIPLYEIVYHMHPGRIEKAFHPFPRATIQTALNHSDYYLEFGVDVSAPETEASDRGKPTNVSMASDTSIAYKLYLECGRLINLYDWYLAFGAILEQHASSGTTAVLSGDPQLSQSEVHARFIKAITELQFMGFIRPTNKKVDHVTRLTWESR
ncbi:origin recognition complex subunit 3 N-terminus-domain-containing protein [Polychytrium aggregatum]|uniref:origin recognition complex subunit 3 N-terminus-domain-containing protein n=1 Tax=Polychytrium aggregatum TaxID=110093 RepID=UPI0022FF15EE|nr:origin recognition complex subunit 3 N-terminus-domain-containing protein [Polychytrium aggregatum]KAI9203629.1 origin recognition complex subunit 3 N-terminus-domain-containing protein [Polychytrium aggregatum]